MNLQNCFSKVLLIMILPFSSFFEKAITVKEITEDCSSITVSHLRLRVNANKSNRDILIQTFRKLFGNCFEVILIVCCILLF